MREVKFRAWFKNKKVMINVAMSNVYFLKNSYWHLSPLPISDYEPIELMEYTGLKDKNGREIYEGDILEFKVMSQVERHCVEYSEYGEWCIGMYLLSTQFEKCEVVGNIYENPETLNKTFKKTV